jgi:hypothetical protein
MSAWLEEISRRDLFVNITIQKIPANLLKEFMDKVVNPTYPGGIGAAIKDLMTKAVQEAKYGRIHLRRIIRSFLAHCVLA